MQVIQTGSYLSRAPWAQRNLQIFERCRWNPWTAKPNCGQKPQEDNTKTLKYELIQGSNYKKEYIHKKYSSKQLRIHKLDIYNCDYERYNIGIKSEK